MGCSSEVSASVMQKNHCHTHTRISHGDGKQDKNTNQERNFHCPEWVSWSFFLHLYLFPRSQLVLNAEASGKTTQWTTLISFRRRDLGVGGRWGRCWQAEPSSQWSPFTRLPWTSGLWDQSEKFYDSEECVSAGYGPKDALFVEKHFLIN